MDIYFEYILFHHSNCQISLQATILVLQLSQLALFLCHPVSRFVLNFPVRELIQKQVF